MKLQLSAFLAIAVLVSLVLSTLHEESVCTVATVYVTASAAAEPLPVTEYVTVYSTRRIFLSTRLRTLTRVSKPTSAGTFVPSSTSASLTEHLESSSLALLPTITKNPLYAFPGYAFSDTLTETSAEYTVADAFSTNLPSTSVSQVVVFRTVTLIPVPVASSTSPGAGSSSLDFQTSVSSSHETVTSTPLHSADPPNSTDHSSTATSQTIPASSSESQASTVSLTTIRRSITFTRTTTILRTRTRTVTNARPTVTTSDRIESSISKSSSSSTNKGSTAETQLHSSVLKSTTTHQSFGSWNGSVTSVIDTSTNAAFLSPITSSTVVHASSTAAVSTSTNGLSSTLMGSNSTVHLGHSSSSIDPGTNPGTHTLLASTTSTAVMPHISGIISSSMSARPYRNSTSLVQTGSFAISRLSTTPGTAAKPTSETSVPGSVVNITSSTEVSASTFPSTVPSLNSHIVSTTHGANSNTMGRMSSIELVTPTRSTSLGSNSTFGISESTYSTLASSTHISPPAAPSSYSSMINVTPTAYTARLTTESRTSPTSSSTIAAATSESSPSTTNTVLTNTTSATFTLSIISSTGSSTNTLISNSSLATSSETQTSRTFSLSLPSLSVSASGNLSRSILATSSSTVDNQTLVTSSSMTGAASTDLSTAVSETTSSSHGSITVSTFRTSSTSAGTSNIGTSTTSSSVPLATCVPTGDFVLNFDDIPPLATDDPINVDPQPVFSPYRKFWFSGGFVVVPPPTNPYLPSSGPQLLEFLKNFDINDGTAGPTTAEIGAGRNEGLDCFRFKALGASLGCDSTGPPCDWQWTGVRYDSASATSNEVTTQQFSTPPCPSMVNCPLIPITLQDTFQDITSVRINVTVAGAQKIFWLDDLELGWYDNTCNAGLCRQSHRR